MVILEHTIRKDEEYNVTLKEGANSYLGPARHWLSLVTKDTLLEELKHEVCRMLRREPFLTREISPKTAPTVCCSSS